MRVHIFSHTKYYPLKKSANCLDYNLYLMITLTYISLIICKAKHFFMFLPSLITCPHCFTSTAKCSERFCFISFDLFIAFDITDHSPLLKIPSFCHSLYPNVPGPPGVPGPGCAPRACGRRGPAFKDSALKGRWQHL